jgi:Putative transmembrane family 234
MAYTTWNIRSRRIQTDHGPWVVDQLKRVLTAMISGREIASLVLVGAFWGCTNPLLRRGSIDVASCESESGGSSATKKTSASRSTFSSLRRFRNVKVWLPYALNQLGSVLFYFSLSQSEMSLVVPISNGLALLFSIVTSYALGERVNRPLRAVLGVTLVMGGGTICLLSRKQ